jgi:mono/diheme cytochrome c family protein
MRVNKLSYLLVAILLVGMVALLGACGDDEGDETTTSIIETETTESDTTDTSADDTGTTGAAAGGEEVWANTCAVCHGEEGGGGQGPNLQTRSDLTKDRVVDQVTNGGGAMPPYSPQLSDDEIDAVADYVLEDIVQQ